MSTAASTIDRQQQAKSRVLTARLVSSRSEWPQIETAFSELRIEDPRTHEPAFFLASVDSKAWDATFILVRDQSDKAVGLLYVKQRKIFGVNSGLYFGDGTLSLLTATEESTQQEVLETALSTLIGSGRVRGLRLFIAPDGYEEKVLNTLAKANGFEFLTAPIERHSILQLPGTYENFLKVLSYKTRRNFRYFRKRSQEAGHVYAEKISLAETMPAIWQLEAECSQGGSKERLQSGLEMLRVARTPLLAAVKSADGELLSFVGGWYEGDRTVITVQLNSDQRYAKYSLSLVMRTYLIESEIYRGCKELFWLGGVAEPIRSYCVPVPASVVCLDSPSLFWRMGRKVISSIRHRLPRRVRVQAELAMPLEFSEKPSSQE